MWRRWKSNNGTTKNVKSELETGVASRHLSDGRTQKESGVSSCRVNSL